MRFLLLDKILSLDAAAGTATGVKAVALSDDVFGEHFPGSPVMPGTLMLEGMAQLAGVLTEAMVKAQGRTDLMAVLTMVDRARFRRVVKPGDRLLYHVTAVSVSDDGARMTATALLDRAGEAEQPKAAEAELTFAFAQLTDERMLQMRQDVLDTWLHGAIAELG